MDTNTEQEPIQISNGQTEQQPLSEQDLVRVLEENLPFLRRQHQYGYVFDGNAYGATKEELQKNLFLLGASRINYIWTPESERLLRPEETNFVLELYKESAVKSAKRSIWISLLFLVFPVALAVLIGDWTTIFLNLFFIIGVALFANGLWSLRQARKLTQEELTQNIAEERNAISYFTKVSQTKFTYQTYFILGSIVAVYLAQMNVGVRQSLYIAGEVNVLVSQGEAWRLLTATVMHGNLPHIFLNGMALWNIGRAIEEQLDSSYISIVFFLSAICGSILSQAFYFRPEVPSIGASGGIM